MPTIDFPKVEYKEPEPQPELKPRIPKQCQPLIAPPACDFTDFLPKPIDCKFDNIVPEMPKFDCFEKKEEIKKDEPKRCISKKKNDKKEEKKPWCEEEVS